MRSMCWRLPCRCSCTGCLNSYKNDNKSGGGSFHFAFIITEVQMNITPRLSNVVQFDPETERVDKINEDLTLISLKDGLIFGTDSYLLAAFAKPSRKGTAVELGAGYGAVSLLCAQKSKYTNIKAIELRKNSASVCERNAFNNGLSNKVEVINADVRKIGAEQIGWSVDAVFSNPPENESLPVTSGFLPSVLLSLYRKNIGL